MGPDLSIVIPAWNERENLEVLLPALNRMVARLGVRAEIIVADGGSRDGTAAAAKALGAVAVQQVERGYGGAVLMGFDTSRAPWVITMDADLSHEPSFIEELWKRRERADLLIASRWVPGGGADMSGFRALLSHILNRTFTLVLRLPFRDISSGFRLYRRSMLKDVRPEARDFDFLEEILIRAHILGRRIEEVPFYYKPRGSGSSHARLIKFGWAFVKTLARMWRLRRG
jgi:dolichol-phosphate mannosyltransferase